MPSRCQPSGLRVENNGQHCAGSPLCKLLRPERLHAQRDTDSRRQTASNVADSVRKFQPGKLSIRLARTRTTQIPPFRTGRASRILRIAMTVKLGGTELEPVTSTV